MIYVLLLLAVTAVWGWTFVLVKDAISQYPTLGFLSLRFVLAAVVMAAVVRRLPGRRSAQAGVVAGLALAAGYLLQTLGLEQTSPGNAGLITGLFVVFTPLIERFTGRPVPARTYAAVVLALAGTVLLSGALSARVGVGDVLVLGCALAFAIHIVVLARSSPGLPSAELALVQMVVCGLVFTGGAAATAGLHPPGGSVGVAIVICGVVASAVAFFIQTRAQAHLTASRTAIVLASEPAWALGFSVFLTGQRFDFAQGVGAALLLVAILGHEALGALRPLRAGRDLGDAKLQ